MRRSLRDPPNETPVRPANLKIGKRTASYQGQPDPFVSGQFDPQVPMGFGGVEVDPAGQLGVAFEQHPLQSLEVQVYAVCGDHVTGREGQGETLLGSEP